MITVKAYELLEMRRDEAARTARALEDLPEEAPQHVWDAARREAREAGMAYWRSRREPPEVRAAREAVGDRSRQRELEEYERAVAEGRTRPVGATAKLLTEPAP